MQTIIHKRVALARAGGFEQVITKMTSGWLVMGDVQFLSPYCLLLPDPVVPHLNAFSGQERQQYLADMSLAGDAILKVSGAARINYEMLGNLEPALHAHLFPRFLDEAEELRTKPVWFYDWENAPKFDKERNRAVMEKIAQEIASMS